MAGESRIRERSPQVGPPDARGCSTVRSVVQRPRAYLPVRRAWVSIIEPRGGISVRHHRRRIDEGAGDLLREAGWHRQELDPFGHGLQRPVPLPLARPDLPLAQVACNEDDAATPEIAGGRLGLLAQSTPRITHTFSRPGPSTWRSNLVTGVPR